MKPFKNSIRAVGGLALLLTLASATIARAAGPAVEIKLGTIIPSGTSYHQALLQMGEKWRNAPGGGAKLIIYPDGRQGGEAAMVRKMRAGQLNAAMLSVIGLSDIDPSVACLQKMPMMFRTWEEVDYVREKLRPQLDKRLSDKGFAAICWGDVGWVRYFSKTPAVHPDDFKKQKIFVWAGDPSHVDIMKTLGYQPIGLETADILPGLQTGLITCVPTTPFFALAGQFDTVAPNMLDMNWVPVVGATIVRKDAWDKIPAEARKVVLDAADEAGRKIRLAGRTENDDAVKAMQKRGLKVNAATPQALEEWRKLAETTYPQIRGKIVPTDLFDEVEHLLKDFRASGKVAHQ